MLSYFEVEPSFGHVEKLIERHYSHIVDKWSETSVRMFYTDVFVFSRIMHDVVGVVICRCVLTRLLEDYKNEKGLKDLHKVERLVESLVEKVDVYVKGTFYEKGNFSGGDLEFFNSFVEYFGKKKGKKQ